MTRAIIERLDWLCGLPAGTVWTEYHWREVCQLQQEVEQLTKETK